MSDLEENHLDYIASLEQRGVKLTRITCPVCRGRYETRSNGAGQDVKTVSQCVHCTAVLDLTLRAAHGGTRATVHSCEGRRGQKSFK